MFITFKGEFERMNESFWNLLSGMVLATLLLYFLQVALFRSWLSPFIIMFTVPLGLIGVVFTLYLTNTTLQNGKAHQMPIQVQVDDGTLAHVVMLGQNGEVVGHMSEGEQVIVSNQEELCDGQPVNAVLREDGTPLIPPQPSR